jgi:hypothetical protein
MPLSCPAGSSSFDPNRTSFATAATSAQKVPDPAHILPPGPPWTARLGQQALLVQRACVTSDGVSPPVTCDDQLHSDLRLFPSCASRTILVFYENRLEVIQAFLKGDEIEHAAQKNTALLVLHRPRLAIRELLDEGLA